MRNFVIGVVAFASLASAGAVRTDLVESAMLSSSVRLASDGAAPAPKQVNGNLIAYGTSDSGMNAAIAEGAASLPRFLALRDAGMPGSYLIKYALSMNGETEHIWAKVTDFKDDVFTAVLDNKPVNGAGVKIGDEVKVARADVEDWIVSSDGGIYGGFTMRYALKDMSDDEASRLRRMLRD